MLFSKGQKPSFKCALITGATSGLGQGLAHFLKEKGITVIGVGSSDYDLATPAGREGLMSLISERQPDLIVNCAGFGLYGEALAHTSQENLDLLEVNIMALTSLTLHGAKTLLANGKKGVILNISSAAAFLPFPLFALYAASKSYVNSFSQALDVELKPQGIRILCACPGQIDTHFRTRASKGHLQKKDRRTMPVEKAARHLWKQIEGQKSLLVFDWKTKLLIGASKLLPKRVLNYVLMRTLRGRY